MMHKIAVIIPAHNAAATIARAIRSALRNKAHIKVFVVDDCSTDHTGEIARLTAPENVTVIRHERICGPLHARFTGIDAARRDGCEFVTFLDDDDTISPRALDICLESILSSGADIVQMRIKYKLTRMRIPVAMKVRYETHNALRAMLADDRAFPIQMCGKLYALHSIEHVEHPLPDRMILWGEDRLFNMSVFLSAPKIHVEPRAVYYYYWGGSTTHQATDNNLAEYRLVHSLKCQFACENHLQEYLPEIDAELRRFEHYHVCRLVEQGQYEKATQLSSPENVRRLRKSPGRIAKKYLKKLF